MYDFIDENMDLLEACEIIQDIEESSTIDKLRLPGRIAKFNKKNGTPVKSMADLLKNHGNPGMAHIIETSKDPNEISYLRDDLRLATNDINKIKKRIELCKSGKDSVNKNYYDSIKKMYIDKGITVKDCDKTLEELDKHKKLCSQRIKELTKK